MAEWNWKKYYGWMVEKSVIRVIVYRILKTEDIMQFLTDNKDLTKEEKDFLRECKKIIESIDPSATLILYGSRARGDAEEESDYDLIILTDKEVTLDREDEYRKQLFPLQLETGTVLTILLVSRKQWDSPLFNAMPFYRNVKREGVYL